MHETMLTGYVDQTSGCLFRLIRGDHSVQTVPIRLSVEIRSANGGRTEFVQAGAERIARILHVLSTPRVFAQPQLIIASTQSINLFPCRAIDMILVRTSTPALSMIPLKSSLGEVYIWEDCAPLPNLDSAKEGGVDDEANNRRTSHGEIQTVGGWSSTLKTLAIVRGTVLDQRQSFAHLLELPVIPFRLADGGVGLINPSNIARIWSHPTPDALPETALPMELLRWMPAVAGRRERISDMRSDEQQNPCEIRYPHTEWRLHES